MLLRIAYLLVVIMAAHAKAEESQIVTVDYSREKNAGWVDDGAWMNLQTTIALEKCCVAVHVHGAGQIYLPLPRMQSGRVYIVTMRMRMDGQIEDLSFGMRKIEGPWTDYGRKKVPVGTGEEQTFRMELRMKDSAAPAELGLFGYIRGTGTIRIASFAVAEAADFNVVQPTDRQDRNLLLNSDFRLMDSGWSLTKAKWTAGTVTFPGSMQYLSPIRLRYGVTYTLLLNASAGSLLNYRVYRTGKWGETIAAGRAVLHDGLFTTTFRPEPPAFGVLSDELSYNVWIASDSPSVLTRCALVCGTPEASELCGFRLSDDVRSRENNIYSHDSFVVDFATTGISLDTAVEVCISDYAGTIRMRVPTTVRLRPDGLLGNQVRLSLAQTGWYTLLLYNNGRQIMGFPAEFVILPRTRSGREQSDFLLGSHLRFDRENAELAADSSLRLRQAVDWGISGVRMHPPLSTKWWMVEPERGKFVFYDPLIDEPRKFGIDVFGLLDGTARYASTAPQAVLDSGDSWLGWGAYPPHNLADWENYVYRMVTHFKGRVRCWEVWNEPDHVFLRLPPNERSRKTAVYLNLLKSAWTAAKRADPGCVIVAGSVTAGGKSFLLECIDMGMLNYCDVVSFHGYGRDIASSSKGAGAFDIVADLKKRMEEFNLVKPIWDSESGPGDIAEGYIGVPTSESVIKGIIARRAAGISRFYLYNGFTRNYPGHNDCRALLGYGGRPLAIQGFLPVYDSFLGNTAFRASCGSPGMFFYEFTTRSGGRIFAGWRTPGAPAILKHPDPINVSAYDVSGRLIGDYAGEIPLSEHLRYFVPTSSTEVPVGGHGRD